MKIFMKTFFLMALITNFCRANVDISNQNFHDRLDQLEGLVESTAADVGYDIIFAKIDFVRKVGLNPKNSNNKQVKEAISMLNDLYYIDLNINLVENFNQKEKDRINAIIISLNTYLQNLDQNANSIEVSEIKIKEDIVHHSCSEQNINIFLENSCRVPFSKNQFVFDSSEQLSSCHLLLQVQKRNGMKEYHLKVMSKGTTKIHQGKCENIDFMF